MYNRYCNRTGHFEAKEYFIITLDGICHSFTFDYEAALCEFLKNYTDDQVVYVRLGLCEVENLLGVDNNSFLRAVSYDIDSEIGFKYNYNNYQACYCIIDDLKKKYNVTGYDIHG